MNLNYSQIIAKASDTETNDALNKIRQIQAIEAYYHDSFFWTPKPKTGDRSNRTRDETISFKLGDDYFSYRYQYKETFRNCYFSKQIAHNGVRITMRTINMLALQIKKEMEK